MFIKTIKVKREKNKMNNMKEKLKRGFYEAVNKDFEKSLIEL